MEDKIDCLLDMIPQESHFYYYFRGCWANGKEGSISDSNGHCVYRFYPLMKDSNGNRIESEIDFDDYVTNPVVATGIIGYWLHFRKNNDCLASYTTWTKEDERKNTLKIFNDYTEDKLKQYIEREQYSPSSWRRDLEKEFYTDFIIPNEEPLNKQSEALFEYITKDDRKLVEEVIEEYMKYLRKCRSDKGYQVNPELLVLRAVESQDNTKYEDLKDYEVNTILDKLEGEGFIRVAWIEGHRPEGTRILDKGRAYLKQLEEGTDVIDVAPVNTPQPSSGQVSTETPSQMTQPDDDPDYNQDEEWDEDEDDGEYGDEDEDEVAPEVREYDTTYDYIFDPRVKPQALFNAMKGIKYHNKITDRRFYYVAFRVFEAINYFSKGTSEHQYLQWINLHFNDYEDRWIDDHDHIYLFRFKLDGTAKKLKEHPSKWNSIKMYSDLAAIHYKLANELKNTFTFVVDDNGDELKDSESYEHLKDYPQYLSGAQWIVDKYLVPDDAYVNKGRQSHIK